MKLTTFSIILGNSLMVWHSQSDSNFLDSVELVSKHLDAVCRAFHGFRGFLLSLCQNYQLCYSFDNAKGANLVNNLDTREYSMCNRIYLLQVRQYGHTGEQSFTLLAAIPKSITILATSLAEAEQCRMDWNSFNSAIIFAICGSNVFGSILQIYDCVWRVNKHSSHNGSAPWWCQES